MNVCRESKEIRGNVGSVQRWGKEEEGLKGIWESEERKRKDVGSEILLYSERCIVQKLLAGGFHGSPRVSMSFDAPATACSRPFLRGPAASS